MPRNTLRPRRIALTVVIVLIAVCVPGLLRIHVETDMSGSWTVPLTPSSALYADYLDRFPPDNGAIVVITGGLATRDRWEALAEFTGDLEALDVVERAESLTTTKYVRGNADSVDVIDVLDLLPEPGAELADLVRAYPPFQNLFITPDGLAAAVYVRAVPEITPQVFTPAVQEVIDRFKPRFNGVQDGDIFQGGEMHVNWELANLTVRSTGLIAGVIVMMFLLTALLSRSPLVGVLAGGTGALSVMITFAFMGYADITLTPMNSLVVFMLVPLGAASILHADAYVRHTRASEKGLVPSEAMRPFVFATFTTMIAFGATAISGYPDVQQFGLIGAMGIGASLLIVFVIAFPVLVAQRSLVQSAPERETPALLLLPLRVSGPVTLLILLATIAFSAFGLTRIEYNLGPVDYFVQGNAVLRDFDRIGKLFGQNPAPLTIFGGAENAAIDPELWRELHAMSTELEQEFPGLHAAWPYESLAQLSLAYTAEDAAPQPFPNTPELMAQYLVLFEDGDLEPYLDWDRSTLTVMFQTPFRSSAEYRPFRDRVRSYIAERGWNAGLTGRIPVFFDAGDKVAAENLESIAMGGVGIFVLLLIVLRSTVVAGIALAVNVLPVVGTLAFMGVSGIQLDIPMSFAAAIALGLVVDDTGHMVARYDVLRRLGAQADDAARTMVREYWRPVFITSVTVVAGFAVMNFAEMNSFRTFSRMICVTMTYALIGDLVFLPALLTHFDRRRLSAD